MDPKIFSIWGPQFGSIYVGNLHLQYNVSGLDMTLNGCRQLGTVEIENWTLISDIIVSCMHRGLSSLTEGQDVQSNYLLNFYHVSLVMYRQLTVLQQVLRNSKTYIERITLPRFFMRFSWLTRHMSQRKQAVSYFSLDMFQRTAGNHEPDS